MLLPRLEQIREEMKKKKLPQGKITSVFLTFFRLLVFYINSKKELIVLNIFYFFKKKNSF